MGFHNRVYCTASDKQDLFSIDAASLQYSLFEMTILIFRSFRPMTSCDNFNPSHVLMTTGTNKQKCTLVPKGGMSMIDAALL
jgi:hypothetical protein